MPLDTQLADKLWTDRYQKELKDFAYKNRYLNEFNDPEDMFQDLAINVWMKATSAFKQDSVTYTTDPVRAFNSFFTTILNQYLANLAAHRQTGKQDWLRTQVQHDRPLSREEEGATLLDTVESDDNFFENMQQSRDFTKMVESLDPQLEEILKFIVENWEPGGQGDLWKQIRNRWGLTKQQLFNKLVEEPEFVDFVTTMD